MSQAHLKNSNFGFIFGTHYELIRRCIVNLPNEDLHNAAAVCKSWNKIVNDVRKSRTKLQCHFKKRKKSSNNKSVGRQQCNENYIQDTMKLVKGLAPKFCIAFCSETLQQSYYRTKSSAARKIHEELRNSLPPDCLSMLAVSDGVMGTQDGIPDIEVAIPRSEAFASVTLPQMPGVKVAMFRRVSRNSGFEIYENGQFIPMSKERLEDPVKCAVLFTSTVSDAAQELYAALKERQSEDFAFGGCVAQALSVPTNLSVSSSSSQDSNGIVRCCGFLFSGVGLRAASVIITQEDEDEDMIVERLNQLKSCDFPLDNSLTFMFSCIGRQFDLEMETGLYRSHFPTTPLLGLIGHGEIGLEYLPKIQGENMCENKKQRRALDHAYSSALVLLSWN